MSTSAEFRIEPSPEILAGSRAWLEPVRAALGADFVAAYITGSVLTQAFDPKTSRINLLVISRALDGTQLEALAPAIPAAPKGSPAFDPLFMTQAQVEKSLDSFPIEWLEIQERHLLLEGADVVGNLDVPLTYLRLQCEHELRGKHIQLRQAFLQQYERPAELEKTLAAAASGLATLFRTLLRLRGEPVPATSAQVIERVSDVYGLDPHALLGAHLVRYGSRAPGNGGSVAETTTLFRKFLAELERLITAIDQLRLP
jgi:hypothetical protein